MSTNTPKQNPAFTVDNARQWGEALNLRPGTADLALAIVVDIEKLNSRLSLKAREMHELTLEIEMAKAHITDETRAKFEKALRRAAGTIFGRALAKSPARQSPALIQLVVNNRLAVLD